MPDENIATPSSRRVGPGSSFSDLALNFARKLGKAAIIYSIGYFNISPAWLLIPVVFFTVRERREKEKAFRRDIVQRSVLTGEKDAVLARVDDVPTWVFFPDMERAEWINRILKQIWPSVNQFVEVVLKNKIEPAVKENLSKFKLKGFSFQNMRLGLISPRVGGIKVYDKHVARSEIVMDMEVFYAGDCDISFELGIVSGGIKDLQISGTVRIIMKPLIKSPPLIGGLQIFFLNNPKIDFDLGGIADLLDLPGVSDVIRRVIIDQVAALMVLPNRLPIVLSEAIPREILKLPEPFGVLRVHVVEAKDLMMKDFSLRGKGKSDPYAILTVGAETFRTQTIDNVVSPKWDYWCEFLIHARGQILEIKLYDEDKLQKDDPLGYCSLDVLGIMEKGAIDTWITLEEADTGMIHLRLAWLQLSTSIDELKHAIYETQTLRVTSMSTGTLVVFIDSVRNLPHSGGKSSNALPDPVCSVSLGKVTRTTNVALGTDSPVFEQGFSFLVPNPEIDFLRLTVTDKKNGAVLGALSYKLSLLLMKESLEFHGEPVHLKNSEPDAEVIMSLRLRILVMKVKRKKGESEERSRSRQSIIKNQESNKESSMENSIPQEARFNASKMSQVTSGSVNNGSSLGRIQLTLKYREDRQKLLVVVHKIENLPLKDPRKPPDTFVQFFTLPGRLKSSKRITSTVKNDCNPTYEETIEYAMSSSELRNTQLEVTVFSLKSSKNNFLGKVVVNLAEMDPAVPTTFWYELRPEAPK